MEYIIGTSVFHKHQISLKSHFIYPAGSIVIYYSYQQNEQSKFLIGKAPVHACIISSTGEYVYTGESNTKNPCINIFKLDDQKEIYPIMQMKGHKFGICQILESPVQPYLVSLGNENDRGLFVFDLNTGNKITVNKLSKNVNSIRFNDKGNLLVSAGQCHLKYWQFQTNGEVITKDGMMDPKSFVLNDRFAYKTFVDIVVIDKLFALTSDSSLCIFTLTNKQLEKWMDLKATSAYSISYWNEFLICGCSDAIIRVFNTNLQHIVTLQKPPNLGNYNIEKGVSKLNAANPDDLYADCIGVSTYDKLLLTVYSDRTIFLWDISNFQKTTVKRSFLNHSGSINDFQIMKQQSSIEATFFVTASSDQTLRIWHIYEQMPTGLRRNAYCKYLSKILYVGDDHKHFKQGQDSSFTIKCVRVSKDGEFIACGDSMGKIRVFSTQTFSLIQKIQAHQQDVLCLDFSEETNYIASGSRDRQINIFDEQFQKIQTLDEHTGSVTHVKFIGNKLISCGQDRGIIFREFNGQGYKLYHQEQLSKILSIDSNQTELFVSLEKKINVYDITTGKLKQSIETDTHQKIILASKDGYHFATFSEKQIKIINQKNEIIQKFQHDQLSSMGFAMNNKQFITVGYDGCIIVWKLSKVIKQNHLGAIGKKLKQVFIQQNLKMSKEWTINSFWVEEELKGFLDQQKDLKKLQIPNEDEDLFKFDDSDEENNQRPPALKQNQELLSPIQDFDYKNQKFDSNEFQKIQQQLQQVETNLSKLPEQLERKKELSRRSLEENQHEVSDFQNIETGVTQTLQYEQQTIKEVDSLEEQTRRDFYQLQNQVDFTDQKQNHSIAMPNPSNYTTITQSQQENSLKVVDQQTQNHEQLKAMVSQFQGLSKESINLNQSYNYSQNMSPNNFEIKTDRSENQFQIEQDKEKERERERQKYIFQQTNLAQYHLRQIHLELDDLQKVLHSIKDPENHKEILKNIDQDMAQIYSKFDQFKNGSSQIPQLTQQSFLEQSQQSIGNLQDTQLQKLIQESCRDIIDNYSKLLLEQFKTKQ